MIELAWPRKRIHELTDAVVIRELRSAPSLRKVESRGDGYFGFRLRGEEHRPFLKRLDLRRIICANVFPVPEDRAFSVLWATTIWNDNKSSSHDSFSYTTGSGACVLESHLAVRTGIPQGYLQQWIEDFAARLPAFAADLKQILDNHRSDAELIASLRRDDRLAAQRSSAVGSGSFDPVRLFIDGGADLAGKAILAIVDSLTQGD